MSTRMGFLLQWKTDLHPVTSAVQPAGDHAREAFLDESPDEGQAEAGSGARRTLAAVLDGQLGEVAIRSQFEGDGDVDLAFPVAEGVHDEFVGHEGGPRRGPPVQ